MIAFCLFAGLLGSSGVRWRAGLAPFLKKSMEYMYFDADADLVLLLQSLCMHDSYCCVGYSDEIRFAPPVVPISDRGVKSPTIPDPE